MRKGKYQKRFALYQIRLFPKRIISPGAQPRPPNQRCDPLILLEHLIKAVWIGKPRLADSVRDTADARGDPPPGVQIAQLCHIILKAHVHLPAEQVSKPGLTEEAQRGDLLLVQTLGKMAVYIGQGWAQAQIIR